MTTHRATYEDTGPDANGDVYPRPLCGKPLKVGDSVVAASMTLIPLNCSECIYIETRDRVEKELHAAGIVEDPDMDGGLLG